VFLRDIVIGRIIDLLSVGNAVLHDRDGLTCKHALIHNARSGKQHHVTRNQRVVRNYHNITGDELTARELRQPIVSIHNYWAFKSGHFSNRVDIFYRFIEVFYDT
jgi:hypothetical protein